MLDLDLVLAILHHLFVFALFAALVAELAMVGRGMGTAVVTRVAAIDPWYGALAGLVLIVGFARAIFSAKGWDYYAHNAFFWAKIGTFLAIGLLSLPPTLEFLRWRRTNTLPTDKAVTMVRRYLWTEVALLPLLPVVAAAMARGYGSF
jgi:putative membrane protein